MRKWIEDQIAAGLPALAGSRLSGTLAVAPALLNELIADWLTPADREPPAGAAAPRLDLTALRAAVRSVAIRAEPDRILVDVDIHV